MKTGAQAGQGAGRGPGGPPHVGWMIEVVAGVGELDGELRSPAPGRVPARQAENLRHG